MKMTKILSISMLMMLLSVPFQSKANVDRKEPKTETEMSLEAKVLLDRLNEIKAMDKSNLSRSEKKELRQEVVQIKSEMKELGGGVYLSVGAIIIILLLLILIL